MNAGAAAPTVDVPAAAAEKIPRVDVWGARADIVLTRGVVLAVEGFDLRPARSGTHLFMGRTYDGARQKVLGMSLTAYF